MPAEKNTVGLRRRTKNGRRQFEIAPDRWVSAERVRQIRVAPFRCRKCRLAPREPDSEYCELCALRLAAVARQKALKDGQQ
jgi:hypothetical protein